MFSELHKLIFDCFELNLNMQAKTWARKEEKEKGMEAGVGVGEKK